MNTMNAFRYQLQPYKGPSSRYKCPSCGKAKEFARYVDSETKELLPDHVGRCNRESSCGYHYSASDYLKENGLQVQTRSTNVTEVLEQEIIDYMPFNYVDKSLNGFMDSHFAVFLRSIVSDDYAEAALLKYFVGRSNIDDGKACIFWRIDKDENVRTGKIISYNPDTGKRDKEKHPTWVHSFIKPFNYKLCFFGEHLLAEFPEATIGITESEKTALIASLFLPDMVWIATGGNSGCKWREYSVHNVLKGRNIILFPDFGYFNKKTHKTCFAEWQERANAITERMDCRIKVSRVLEDSIPVEERENDYDLADLLIKRENNKGWALTNEGYPMFWDLKISA